MNLHYNLALAAADVAALAFLTYKRDWAAWRIAMVCVAGVAILLAAVLGGHHFRIFRYVSYATFFHAPALLIASAVVLRGSRKGAAACLAGAVLIVAVAVEALLIEPTWLEVSYMQIETDKLDRPVRIVILADLQTDQFGQYEERVLRRVAEEEPDLILLAGDYIQIKWQLREALWRLANQRLREIGLSAPDGVYAVRGNVDPSEWAKLYEGLPVTTVETTRSFDTAGLHLTCLGCGDSFNPDLKVSREDSDRFHLVLGHCPNFALGQVDADLLVAGHTHGGQVRLPFIGPLMMHCSVPRSWAVGLTELSGGRKLLVSRGVGMERGGAPRLRFLCRPQLIVLDLVPVK